MGNKVKEEERVEKIIRGLLKLPENKRCINCNSLGPQYVCTTFWTFVCTTCGGVHREFTHRVKSVSMAKFTAEEVSALQAGGNERARETYLKAWDPQLHSMPDGSSLLKIREYIRHVYVERRYAGERNTDSPLPQLKLHNKLQIYEKKPSTDTYARQHGNERPESNGRHDVRYYHDEWRSSPRYARENSRSGGFKRSPIRFEVVDDRFRDDTNGRGKRSDPRRISSVDVMPRSQSPVLQKNVNRSMSPVVRQISDLLGQNVPQLQVGSAPKENNGKNDEASSNKQKKDPPPTKIGCSVTEGKPPKNKNEESASLIDFDMDPQPLATQTTRTEQTQEAKPVGHSVTTLESLLFELNGPSNESVGSEQKHEQNDATLAFGDTSTPADDTPEGGLTSVVDLLNDFPTAPPSQGCFTEQSSITGGQHCEITDQQMHALCSSIERSSSEQFIQAFSSESQDTNSITAPKTPPAEATADGRLEPPARKELPEDLFSLSYPPVAPPVTSWQTGQPPAVGFGMRFGPSAYQTAGFLNSTRNTNPFDLSDGSGSEPDQSAMVPKFPSTASTQGALPNASVPAGFLQTPSLSTPLAGPHSIHSTGLNASQQPTDSHMRPQSRNSADPCGFDFGSYSSTDQLASAPDGQNPFPASGSNPFE